MNQLRQYNLESSSSLASVQFTFMSTRVQFWVAQAFSRISKMATVLRFMMSTSQRPMIRPARLKSAASTCSSDHCGSLLASSWGTEIQLFLGYKSNTPQHGIKKQQVHMMAAVYGLDEY